MGRLLAFPATPEGDHYDHLAERHDATLAEERAVSDEIARLRRRFVAGDLVVESGPRRGQPLTPMGRQRVWDRIWTLRLRQLRLLDEQMRLYKLVTGWREREAEEVDLVARAEDAT